MATLADSKLLYSGPDWDFELIRRVHEACGEIGIKEMGLDPYPNQIEVITTEQMLDAYASTGTGRSARNSPATKRSTATAIRAWRTRSS